MKNIESYIICLQLNIKCNEYLISKWTHITKMLWNLIWTTKFRTFDRNI